MCWSHKLARGRGGATKTQARHLRSTVACCERSAPKLDIKMDGQMMVTEVLRM